MAALSFKRYVDVTSGVIGAGGTTPRELIGRLFTTNQRMDADEVLEFQQLSDVGDRFGYESQEYYRARFYLGWISPAITKPRSISFARYTPTGVPPRIFGGSAASLDTITALGKTAALTLTIGSQTYYAQGIDVQTDISSYSDVADTLQSAVNGLSDDEVVKSATVTFDSTNTSFVFTAGTVSNDDISLAATPLSDAIGWTSNDDSLLLAGHTAMSVAEAIQLADGISNNYSSVAFIDQLGIADHVSAAQTLNGIDDSSYIYCVPCERKNYKEWQSRLSGLAGVAIGLIDNISDDEESAVVDNQPTPSGATVDTGNYVEMVPMIQMAATDYSRRNATSSYMYREFDLPVVVDDNTEANALDKLRINYYGKTQEAGRTYAFYQKAYLQGPATAAIDQSVFANEIWLKSEARVEFMDLLRTLQELPANETGRTFGLSTLQGLVDKALRNGVISVGKTLDVTQRAAVSQLSGDPDAWRQVQSIGYWMDVQIESFTNDAGVREYKLTYILIYSKKDVVRSVTGTHALV